MTVALQKNSLLIIFIFCFHLVVPAAFAQQVSKSLRLDRLEFEGLKRYGKDQIVEASGLTIGQPINETLLDESANRLVQTGFFKNVSYRVRATGTQATVTFQVEEKNEVGLPVVFDNFVWFSDDELTIAIRREIPSYDGTALEVGNMTSSIKEVLQRLLQEKKIPGQVEHMTSADPSAAVVAHVYTIKGTKIPICELAFIGASAIKDQELSENSKPIFDEDYSRGIVFGFANLTLGDLYRQRGYLRAQFKEPASKPRNDESCKNGVDVTLTVQEGLQYTWAKAEWIDNKSFSASELDAALGMTPGELASITKINKGLHQVSKTFGTKGYITATLRPVRDFDDANKRVTFRFKVIEGAQYKMGALVITGLPDDVAARLKAQWKLMPGEVYNGSYLTEFINTVMVRDASVRGVLADKSKKVSTSMASDRKSLTVSVTISVK
jgi:outer membrane protein insertion porin family